ncbi:MAG: hypothetical protein WC673_02835 [Candidatus Paceibacterota bacterium]|jgi:hypothetical protein
MEPQNKNKLILLIIVALVIAGGVFAAYSVVTKNQANQQLVDNDRNLLLIGINNSEWKSCNKDTDCVVVEGKTCCGCPGAINQNFVENWNSLKHDKCSTPAPLCSPCLPLSGMKAICEDNRCKAINANPI